MVEDSSIFQEIDEALRVDNFEKFLRRYGKLIIAGCVSIVLATAVSVFWKSHVHEQNMKDADILIAAENSAQSGKYAEAEQKFREVEKSMYGIAVIAKLERAKMLLAQSKSAEAQALYKEVANYTGSGSDEALRDFAALDAATLAANNNPPGEAQKSMSGRPFYPLSQELYALALQKQGKTKEALEILDGLARNPLLLAPERRRAAELRNAIKGKGQ